MVLSALLPGCAGLPANNGRTPSQALADPSGTTLSRHAQSGAPADTAARHRAGFRLLGNAEDAYASRLALIDAAEKTLDLQYYSIHYDSSTDELLHRLRQAALRGVRVRILIDDFNAAGDNAEVLRMDEVPNIEVRLFNPVMGPRSWQAGRLIGAMFDFQRIQQRMHNKAFIADNALAVTGGRNLGDDYFGHGSTSNFLDLDILVAGDIVRQISGTFDAYWNDPVAYPAAALLTPRERARIDEQRADRTADSAPPPQSEQSAPAAPGGLPPKVPPPSVPAAAGVASEIEQGTLQLVWAPATYVADQPTKISGDEPDDEEETVVDGLVNLIQRAQADLLIVSPYFVPGADMMKAFEGIRQRGVRVRVLTNSLASNDAPLAHVGYARYRKALLAIGVELYELRASGDTDRRLLGSTPQGRSSLHAKTLVMDDRLLVVGTMNLDMRSALQNTEAGIVIRNRAMSAELTAGIEKTLLRSYHVELQDGVLVWHPPADDTARAGQLLRSEPDASTGLKLLVNIAGPFAPDEML
ncbi:phospholipase D family protein [Xylophilus sp. GOD-11R]|uniref:phospholipase D-like domain-containing protein n=1 Tax=Xylophilus sp. GOD-11R TaxID=3089814 RepID=UPI00298CBC66|nr:phospholipase D family protein [Xylophilus sp. GOD-11R]WPB59368.1 phospholipase D family protein [Xylophilus sp. GOD-11R]